ncbi:MAG: hypothetical protein M3494_04135 [Actinomycetota bacterium]|nr:hypothetical protein [Actinomycetota bacterium]
MKDYFEGRESVPSGVCSIQPREGRRPWIVCPRRLLVLGREGVGDRAHQNFAESMLMRHSGFSPGERLGVWPEVKVRHVSGSGDARKSFDYTFDYVVMPLRSIEMELAGSIVGIGRESRLREVLLAASFSLSRRDGVEYVDDFPQGDPLVVEIMTSSTSGGNKRKRTTVPQAFEDAVLKGIEGHTAPSINYRQVWARMVSQLIVKSEAGAEWGGKTVWILQDALADYISSSTALNLRRFRSDRTSEVNIMSLSYGDAYEAGHEGVAELTQGELFSGPARPPGSSSEQGFQDMIRAPTIPPKNVLLRSLALRRRVNTMNAP